MKREKRYCGYAGYYKDTYLRSTLEFIYASYLDSIGRSWLYEYKTLYLITGESYKPDFYIPELDTYVEIKGDCYKAEDSIRIKKFIDELDIEVELLVEKDLKQLIKTTNLHYNELKNYWKTIAKKENNNKGTLNPRYNREVSEVTKNKIREGVKEAWKNPVVRQSYLDALSKRDYSNLKGKLRSKRVVLLCKNCKKEFIVTEKQQLKRIYCSVECVAHTTSHLAREAKAANKNRDRIQIKNLINTYLEVHYLNFKNVKYNRLNKLLNPLIEYIYTLTGIKDIRSISIAYTGQVVTRKQFMNHILVHIENVRRTIENKESIELEDKKPLG